MTSIVRRIGSLFGRPSLLPLSERERRAEAERTMAKVRAAATVFYAIAAAAKPGDELVATWVVFGVLLAGTVIGIWTARSDRDASFGRELALTTFDCAVLMAVLANNTSDPHDVVYIAALLPTIEGALRWARRGGLALGALLGAVVAAWTLHVMSLADLTVAVEQPLLRGGSMLVVGWAIGSIVANLRDQQVALQLALDSADDPVLTVDRNGCVHTANEAASAIFGRPSDQLIGCQLLDLLTPDGEALNTGGLLGEAGTTRTTEVAMRADCGRARWLEVQIIPIADLGISYARLRDVTTRKEATQRLRHQATHDHLTDLPNRRFLTRTLAEALVDDADVTVVFIDLDRFKEVNDRLGHDAGDDVLRQAAERMRCAVRGNDVVGRLAGDEFCVLLLDADRTTVELVTDRLRQVLHDPFSVEGETVEIGASIGAARHSVGESPDELVRRADEAMYVAKAAGGNQVHLPALRSVS